MRLTTGSSAALAESAAADSPMPVAADCAIAEVATISATIATKYLKNLIICNYFFIGSSMTHSVMVCSSVLKFIPTLTMGRASCEKRAA